MAEDGYYGYVEGEAANQINWGEIGKNMSDMLVTQKRVREEKRVAIDDASRDLGEELAKAPVGTYDAGNKFILGYAENAQQYRMMTDKLLKSGQLKLKDYMVGRANINSNTETLFDLTAGWQAEHAIKLQRLKENKSQPLEALLMEELEAMANLRDVTAMPDPTNGLVNLTRTTVGSDGMKKTKAITVQQMRAETSQQFDRYQLEENVSALVKNLGISEIITNSNIPGGIREFLKEANTTTTDEYKAWEANTIDGITSNPFDTLSLLTVQGEYKPTTDKAAADADPKLIYVDTTAGGALPEIKFTDPQLTAAKKIIRNSIRAKIDNKVSAQYQREGLTKEDKLQLLREEERSKISVINAKNKKPKYENFKEIFTLTESQKFNSDDLKLVNAEDDEALKKTSLFIKSLPLSSDFNMKVEDYTFSGEGLEVSINNKIIADINLKTAGQQEKIDFRNAIISASYDYNSLNMGDRELDDYMDINRKSDKGVLYYITPGNSQVSVETINGPLYKGVVPPEFTPVTKGNKAQIESGLPPDPNN